MNAEDRMKENEQDKLREHFKRQKKTESARKYGRKNPNRYEFLENDRMPIDDQDIGGFDPDFTSFRSM